MADAPKIATCCYCGSTTSLVLRGDRRHELACQRCGAPLRRLKALPIERIAPETPRRADAPKKKKRKKTNRYAEDRDPGRDAFRSGDRDGPRRPRREPPRPERRRRPKRRFTFSRMLSELIDEFEDFFD